MSETLRQLLSQASQRLSDISDSPRLDAELLLCQALACKRSWLFSHADDVPPVQALQRFEATLKRRQSGEPVAYILGTQEFWSLPLRVSTACLIPRADTECLVEWALSLPGETLDVVDLGTGSGAIAIALASEKPRWRITASDVSNAALEIARHNAQAHHCQIEFLQGDWLTPMAGRQFDLIISNPPYIAEDDAHLARLQHEPGGALSSGHDGLDAIRELAANAPQHLRQDAYLALEHGFEQGPQVHDILHQHGFLNVTTAPDLAGRERFTHAQWSQL